MKQYGWTIQEVDGSPYEKLLTLIIEKEQQKQDEVMNGADFINSL
ncbi:hypothetical protein [Salinicoccus carnicancri]|nr:hypothetical protein [Salinicoccus carnicancri]